MNIRTQEQQKREGGFTLVELAIVMIIIGLLIGGILKGQELIANSQVTATISQVKGIDAAVSTFRDKYAALPGDIDPTNRLANCVNDPCSTPGNGNGRIEGATAGEAGIAPDIEEEGSVVFSHMAAANLLSGVDSDGGTATYGSALPEGKAGGGFNAIEYSTGTLSGATDAARRGHYLVYSGDASADVDDDSGAIVAARAAQIDRKLDDGQPNVGSIRVNDGCADATGAAGAYQEGNDDTACSLYFRVQG